MDFWDYKDSLSFKLMDFIGQHGFTPCDKRGRRLIYDPSRSLASCGILSPRPAIRSGFFFRPRRMFIGYIRLIDRPLYHRWYFYVYGRENVKSVKQLANDLEESDWNWYEDIVVVLKTENPQYEFLRGYGVSC